jgi:hypothetical protein
MRTNMRKRCFPKRASNRLKGRKKNPRSNKSKIDHKHPKETGRKSGYQNKR